MKNKYAIGEARQYLKERQAFDATALIEELFENEPFKSRHQEEHDELFYRPDLKATEASLKEHGSVWSVTPDNPIQGWGDGSGTDYYSLQFDKVVLDVVNEDDGYLEYYDRYLNLEDVSDEIELDPEYEQSHDFRYNYLVPGIQDYFSENGIYLVKYQGSFFAIEEVEEIAIGDTYDEMLQNAWQDWDEDKPSTFIDVAYYYLVDSILGSELETKGEKVVNVLGLQVWVRQEVGRKDLCYDPTIQAIALEYRK